jgi:adenine-specific DNA-methyltransferase
MARIDDLMSEISEAALKARLQREIAELKKDKKFGLVFERHLPELEQIPLVFTHSLHA